MAGYKIGPPPMIVPMYLPDGRMDPQWIAWFNAVWALIR